MAAGRIASRRRLCADAATKEHPSVLFFGVGLQHFYFSARNEKVDVIRVGGRNENDRPTRELRVIANRVSVVLLAATAAAAAVAAAAAAAAAAVKSSSHSNSNSSNSSSQSVYTILLFAQNYLAKIAVLTST
ncbi:hypothetical protein HZH66_007553 [Vespula vulgaris]|uniref:Uncharacterized protein n=1 Tax=Vespula vulgaris TaxID=7454 RepID=A0A834K3P3_VESVU|nr:hypothetical protein HZH66_007553 [Vespula vulgaris]